MTPPAKVSDPALVQQTANLIAGSHANRLVAVLAPQISRDQRAALLQELRQRKLTAAVVDNLDLCRLLNIDGRQINLVIGLLEVMLEQQRWIDSSPFHAHDGAQARIEMYVGRVQEANVLATDNKYSRLFSGRKLGKSALLKFIEETYDGFRLPSGNTLRVLRIPIVGIQSDAMVINKVLSELRNRLAFQSAAGPEHSAEPFLAALDEYLTVHPTDSLLVILDEADVFVEKQLEEYDLHQESCLSFRIRSDAQKKVDVQGLPRIRFVFAGYRKANTRAGAWGNWGDPLLLNPLEAEEAAELIAGPLARLGIDASAVAPSVAFRCGYQPAVLLRFGEKLLEVFDNRFPNVADRDHVGVTPEQVAEVYQHQAIQDEIRTVVRNNFQGNDAGQAVFSATLLAFAALAPGDALPNAAETIWQHLRKVVDSHPDVAQMVEPIGWLAPRADGADPTEVGLNEVKRHLEDFVERKLLVIVNRDDGVYRLRFPYHLSSLLVGVQDEAWAALLRLSRGATSAKDDDRTGDPLSLLALRDLETVLKKYGDLGLHYRAAVLGSLWPQSVSREDWLANRLGFDPGRLSHAGQPRDPNKDAYLDVNAADAQKILESRQPNAPPAFLIGGVDLLRWGLHAVQMGNEIEVQAQGRLSRLAIDRWFRRSPREFGFQGDDLEQIISVTGRMPYLLQLFDQCLREAVGADGGIHVGPEEFARAKAKYDKRLPECLSRLRSGPETVRLTSREVEILLMVTVVARANGFKHPVLLRDLGADWAEQLYEEQWRKDFPTRIYPRSWSDDPEERLTVKLVTDLGLLPHPIDQPDANAPLLLNDPLVQVIVPALIKAGV